MPIKPYELLLYSSVLGGQAFQVGLTKSAQNWRRSIRMDGGFWRGRFSLTGNAADLQRAFDTWMCYHLEERTGGMVTWEGMVYEMDLRYAGVTRRRSFDLMTNVAKTSYATRGYQADNLLGNPGFEYYVPPGNFDSWVEGDGVLAVTGAGEYHGGAAACKVTADGSNDNGHAQTYIRQAVNVTQGDRYRLSVWTRGDGSGPGRIGVRDPNLQDWLIYPDKNGVKSTTYQHLETFEFLGPPAQEVLVYFYAGFANGRAAYFDDVILLGWGDIVAETDWTVVDATGAIVSHINASPSVVSYGRKEEMLLLDNYPQATAEAYRDTVLRQYNEPAAHAVSVARPGEARLDITVVGYVATMNWLYQTSGDGSNGNLSDWLEDLVGSDFGLTELHGGSDTAAGDCQFVKVGNVASNTLQVNKKSTVDARTWDIIQELIDIGIEDSDAAGEYTPAHGWVDVGRLFHYGQVEDEPRYYIRHDGIYDKAGSRKAVSPQHIRPAVFRDMTYPVRRELPHSFLQQSRDMLVIEVEVHGDTGRVLLKTGLFEEEDLLTARADFLPVTEEPERGRG